MRKGEYLTACTKWNRDRHNPEYNGQIKAYCNGKSQWQETLPIVRYRRLDAFEDAIDTIESKYPEAEKDFDGRYYFTTQ